MKILFVNHSMAIGGIETMIRDFCRALTKKGHSVSVAVFESGGILESTIIDYDGQVFDLKKKEGIDLLLPFRLRSIIKHGKFDVVHTHNYSPWFYGAIACAGLKKVKLIHTEHSTVERLKRRFFLEKILSFFTDSIVPVSKRVMSNLIDDIGINGKRIFPIWNGIDTDVFHPDEKSKITMRKRLGIDTNVVVLGIIARLVPVKNHKMLLHAFSKIYQHGFNAKLLIVGDGVLRVELESMCHDLGIADSVIFMGQCLNTAEILTGIDLYILPSIDEGMNLTLLEAMSAGIPCVASRVGGNPELVSENLTGYLFDSGNVIELSDCLIKLISNSQLRVAMGDAARKRVMENFMFDKTVDSYINLYGEQK